MPSPSSSTLQSPASLARAPAQPGDPLDAVETPTLIVELDALERNIESMARGSRGTGIALRPHAKSHKCPEIARRQMTAGAVGVCCQKVAEAEAMAEGGIADILVANEVVDPAKLARLAALAASAEIALCVDDQAIVEAAAGAADAAGTRLTLLVEIDAGAHRCGVAPGEAAVELARKIEDTPRLRFGGIQVYQGGAQHIRDFAERRAAAVAAAEAARATVDALAAAGLACPTVTGAGTGTWAFEAGSGVYTEIQPGSYVFMDADYALNRAEDGGPVRDFEQSLFLWTQAMSRPAPDRAVLDAGLKAMSVDSGPPLVGGLDGASVAGVSDEHTVLTLDAGAEIAVGDKVRLVPGHCDPTVNLHDWLVATRGNRVEAVWPVTARGPGL